MFNDNDRYAAKLQLESQARVELGLYVLAKQVGNVDVDEEAISRTILAALTPDKIAAAIPPAIAADVVDELTKRLAS